jgi:hypothetical protein
MGFGDKALSLTGRLDDSQSSQPSRNVGDR